MTSTPTETTSPDAAPSSELRPLADRLAGILNDVPTITEQEVIDRHVTGWFDERAGLPAMQQYRPKAFDLPGFGKKYDGREGRIPCGAEIPHLCKGCGYRIDIGRTCARSRCPRCGAAWVLKRAPDKVNRVHSAAKIKSARSGDGTPVYKHHAAFMPPTDILIDADEPHKELMNAVQNFMREIDMDGFGVYHGWAGETGSHEDFRGEWKNLLFSGLSWDQAKQDLVERPHVHVIGACEWFPGGDVIKEIHQKTGWVVKRFTERNGSAVSLGDMEAIASAATYAISHASIDTRGDRNQYQHFTVGSAYHDADDRHLAEAKQAVHKVAPTTLGIPSMEIECRNELPESECEHDHDDVPDADGDGDLEQEETTDTTDPMAPCRGDLVTAEDAEFVEEESWQQTALHAEEAVETRREWVEAGGWEGWSGQTTLTEPPPAD